MHLSLALAGLVFLALMAAPLFAFGRANRQSGKRSRLSPRFQPAAPVMTWTAAINANKARITTATPYVLSGAVPPITVQGVNPTAVTAVSALVFDLTYAANVVATNVMVVPAGVNAVRNASGGPLAAGQVTF